MNILNFASHAEPIRDPRGDPRTNAGKLGVEEIASRDGQDNQPLTNSKTPGSSELEIRIHHETLIGEVNDEFLPKLQVEQAKQETAHQTFGNPPFKAEIRTIVNEVAALKGAFRLHGAELQHQVSRSLADLNAFRNNAKLSREPMEPRSAMLHWAIAVFLVLIEAGANTPFFAVGNSLGLVGGLATAASVAALNVFLALGAGALLRYINHVSWRVKAVTWSFAGLYAGALCIFHLAIAHWRNALSGFISNVEPGMEGRAALAFLVKYPFSLLSIESCMLVVIGVAFAIVALIAGFRGADRYPGYSDVVARYREAVEALNGFKSIFVANLHAIFEGSGDKRQLSAEQRIDHILTAALASIGVYVASAAITVRLMMQYQSLRGLVDASLAYCISLYRRVNCSVRSTDAPDYFSDAPEPIDADKCLDLNLFKPLEIDQKLLQKNLIAAAEDAKKELREIQSKLVDGIPTLFAELAAADGSVPVRSPLPTAPSGIGSTIGFGVTPAGSTI